MTYHAEDREKLIEIVNNYCCIIQDVIVNHKEDIYEIQFKIIVEKTIEFQETDNIINLYKLFDINGDGGISLNEFINGFRTKMTKLDQNNMNLIEKSLKRVFRNLDEGESKTSV